MVQLIISGRSQISIVSIAVIEHFPEKTGIRRLFEYRSFQKSAIQMDMIVVNGKTQTSVIPDKAVNS